MCVWTGMWFCSWDNKESTYLLMCFIYVQLSLTSVFYLLAGLGPAKSGTVTFSQWSKPWEPWHANGSGDILSVSWAFSSPAGIGGPWRQSGGNLASGFGCRGERPASGDGRPTQETRSGETVCPRCRSTVWHSASVRWWYFLVLALNQLLCFALLFCVHQLFRYVLLLFRCLWFILAVCKGFSAECLSSVPLCRCHCTL